ncbi:hypothetical protein Bbelb_391350 [Branchiostoma belcheri]|nr:hypothetical protein Bbelb_391350 [Branchiostoma belcheri]
MGVVGACVDHEISKPEVQLQYHNKPLGGPKSNLYQWGVYRRYQQILTSKDSPTVLQLLLLIKRDWPAVAASTASVTTAGVRLQYYIDRESSNGKNTHLCINTGMPADGGAQCFDCEHEKSALHDTPSGGPDLLHGVTRDDYTGKRVCTGGRRQSHGTIFLQE